jgi:hypothetical protein
MPENLQGVMSEVDLTNDAQDAYNQSRTFEKLAHYCRCIGAAKEHRIKGRVTDAMRLERVAENIYAKLPDWARW